MKAFTITLLFLISCSLQLLGQNPLVGTWELRSDSTRSVKIITPTHWMVFTEAIMGDTNIFMRSHGGTYTLQGNKYIEYIRVASWDDYGKEKTDFTVQLKGNQFSQKGPLTLSDGTIIAIDEIWHRVSAPKPNAKNKALGAWHQLTSSYVGPDGVIRTHTNATATRFELISPTHWMRISHRNNHFESAMGGPYTMDGNKMILELKFASFPFEDPGKAELTQKIRGKKRYVHGNIIDESGRTVLTWDDVFEKESGKKQVAKVR